MNLYYGIIFIAPGMIGNAVPVFVSGLGRVDGGRTFYRDGKPILGSHKTRGGLISAVLAGGLVGIAAPLYFPEIFYGNGVEGYTYIIGFIMGFGAMFGDSFGSFLKRRINIRPGGPFPIMDQIGFVFFAYLFAAPFVHYPIIWPLLVVPFTFLLHLTSNLLAYSMGWKDVWY